MERLSRHLRLVRIFISEEHRLNASMIGRLQFLMFPLVILFMSFVFGLASERLLQNLPLDQACMLLHAVIVIYGLGVGGLATFGDRIAERRFGSVSMVLEMPATQPVSYRELFTAFYVKEIIYYTLYSILPLIGGIALTIPITGFQVSSVMFLLMTVTLSFLFGLSFSFLISAVYVRSKATTGAVLSAVVVLVLIGLFIDLFDVTYLVPSIALQQTNDNRYLLAALFVFILFSTVALRTVKVTHGKRSDRYEARMIETADRFSFVGTDAKLMGKDWIDLIRSRTLVPVIGAYIGPMAITAVLFWFLENTLTVRLDLNIIFYASMIGFFSVSIYSWLNLLDNNSFMEVLPVTVAQVIRTKLVLLAMIAVLTSTVFLVSLGITLGDLDILPLALVVAYVTTAYTVTGTAYLTGLRTNSYFFDPRVLGKFCGLSIPPLLILMILSFTYSSAPSMVSALILSISAIMAVTTLFLYGRIGKRWGRETFQF